MPRTRVPAFPSVPVTEDEEIIRLRFIQDHERDCGKLTDIDRHLLNMASYEMLRVYRLFDMEFKPGATLMDDMRHSPLRELLALLDAMDCTRKRRLANKQPESDSEQDLRDVLMSLSKKGTHNGR